MRNGHSSEELKVNFKNITNKWEERNGFTFKALEHFPHLIGIVERKKYMGLHSLLFSSPPTPLQRRGGRNLS